MESEWKRFLENNTTVALVVAPIFYVVAIPLFGVVFLANELARLVVRCLLYYNYGSTIKLVEEGLDAISNFKTDGTTRNILIFGILQPGTYSSEKAAKMFQEQVVEFEREDPSSRSGFKRPYHKLKQIMTTVYGYTCWKMDVNFDVRNHFRDVDDDRIYTKEDVMILLSSLAEDMDETKPQWEWIYIPRYQDEIGDDVKSGHAIRFHHAYMDGLSLLLMFSRQLCVGNTPLQFDPTTTAVPISFLLQANLKTLLFAPAVVITEILTANTKHWAQNGPFPGGKKIYDTTPPIDIHLLKTIRLKTKASVTNVVFKSFILAAMEVLSPDRIFNKIRVGEVLPMIPYRNSDPQNKIGGCSYFINARTGEKENTEESFASAMTQLRTDRTRAVLGAQPFFIYYSFKFSGRLPRSLMSATLRQAHYALFLSNLPAFVRNMEYLGAHLDELAAWPPMPNLTGITLASISYGDALKITANVDPSWISHQELRDIFIRIPTIIRTIAEKGHVESSDESDVPGHSNKDTTIKKSYEECEEKLREIQLRSRINGDNSMASHMG